MRCDYPCSLRPPTWADLVSLAMGVTLLAGFGVGVVSTVPAFLAGGMGSLLATGVLVGGGVTKRPTQ